ncbi:MAG: PilT/PilU family type 4a pilus ATPase, partial [bacterium]|nr:PilT/PilU family type 4a pilus ATPase [bacterium]
EFAPLLPNETEEMIFSVITPEQKEIFLQTKELDLSLSIEGLDARFRVNVFFQRGTVSGAFRNLPLQVPTLEELNLPPVLKDFCNLLQGFVLITGPTGQGKSTTLASMIRKINETRAVHVVTIEDPIEFVFPHGKALIEQREMNFDTTSWALALRSALREDPDVVLVGEMRDFETISSAVTIAETGHLVLATLHTNSAAQSIDRIIDVFPESQQSQIRTQLAVTLHGIVSQRLIPDLSGGRVPAVEILLASPAVRNVIREQKTYQIDNVISTSYDLGMISLERSLAQLVKDGRISVEEAKLHTVKPAELSRLLR